MAAFDTSELLQQIRDKAKGPSGTPSGWADADLLRMVNSELLSVLAPQLMEKREEYLHTTKDYTMTAGTAGYLIPTRAVLGGLRNLGAVATDGVYRDLTPLSQEEMDGLKLTTTGKPSRYYLEASTIQLYPVPDAAETLRVKYVRRPSRIVAANTSTVGVVSSKTATVVTLTATKPTTFTTSSPLDFIQGTPHFDALADDKTPTVASGTSITFAAGVIPSSLVAGDYLALAGESPVVQLPVEVFYLLAQRVANALMRNWDQVGLKAGEEEEARLNALVLGSALSPRNRGAAPSLISNSFFA